MREKQYIIKYNGKHFSTVHTTAVPGISVAKGGERELASAEVQESDTVRYVGPFDLRGGQAVFRFDGGHIYIPFAQTYQPRFFYYHVKDHLGNVRVTKIGVGETGYVLQRMNYYPFGGMYEAEDVTNNAMPWKFGGKELDVMHGLNLYDFHARPYDARLGQFTMIDPCAEDYYHVSPYVYCLDNPLNAIDIHGDSVVVLIAPNGANGAGHMAILIQNPDLKWELWSKNGTADNFGMFGREGEKGSDKHNNRGTDKNENHKEYSTTEEFFNDTSDNPLNKDGIPEYTEGYLIPTSKEQDIKARVGAEYEISKDYNVLSSNCAQTVQSALKNAGLKAGNGIIPRTAVYPSIVRSNPGGIKLHYYNTSKRTFYKIRNVQRK